MDARNDQALAWAEFFNRKPSLGKHLNLTYMLPLESRARDCLKRLVASVTPAHRRVRLELVDGWDGLEALGPYDAIHVGAAAERLPTALVSQLARGGRMVVPVGPEGGVQELVQVDVDRDGRAQSRSLMGVRYVPLVKGVVGAPKSEL